MFKKLIQRGASALAGTDLGRRRLLAAANGSALARYGVLEDLELDLAGGCLRLVVRLHGEAEPLELRLRRYRLIGEAPALALVIDELECDRAWLAALAADHLVGRSLPIPAEHAGAAEWLARLLV